MGTQSFRRIIRPFGLGMLIWISGITTLAFAADLTLNTWTAPPLTKQDRTGYIDQILIEAFNRLDLTVAFTPKPAERSLREANHGVADGDYLRVPGLEKIYPNLMRVPSKLFEMEFVAFAKNKNVKVDGWASLEAYKVGIMRGWKILEANVKDTKSRMALDSIENMFKMVHFGRLDVGIYSRHLGRGVLEEMGVSDVKDLDPPFAVKEMFLYLNKKHAKLIPELGNVLDRMRVDGTFQEIFDRTLKEAD